MLSNIKFSVIVPVYNVEKYLDECIDSVLNQDYCNLELMLCDDGSTDKSGEICDSFAKKDQRVKVFHLENKGASAARNVGIKEATGDYIIFLDSDDYWEINCLGEIAKTLSDSNVDVLAFRVKQITESKEEIAIYPSVAIYGGCKNDTKKWYDYFNRNIKCWGIPWNKAIKLDFIKENNLCFKEGITAEDIDWAGRLFAKAKVFDVTDTVVCIHRCERDGSVTYSMDYNKLLALKTSVELAEKCGSEISDGEKMRSFDSYITYEYATLIYSCILINDKRINGILNELERKWKTLKPCSDNKVKLMRLTSKVFGFKVMFKLLKFV